MIPSITIITPITNDRLRIHRDRMIEMVRNQKCKLIMQHLFEVDDGERSIGEKLNAMIDRGHGQIIIRMDSDDHYSTFYIQHAVDTLLKHDKQTIVGLSSCFFYDQLTNKAWEYTWNDITQRLVLGATQAFYKDSGFRSPETITHPKTGEVLNHGEDNVFCSKFPKVVYGDYKEHFVAIKHGRNTSPYNFRDSCYEPANVEYVKSLMK